MSGNGRKVRRCAAMSISAAMFLIGAASAHAADTFQKPTKEELEMKSLPGYPGAAAVVLFREEITKDDMRLVQHYERIKILTEEGKKYANVELGYVSTHDVGGEYSGDDKSLGDIAGRTVHADGTVIPFTGKPYLKTVEKGKTKDIGFALQEKVFTLPDVEVGSIIEYRYATRYSDSVFESPDWYIQSELYVKAAHYVWFPTSHDMIDNETQQLVNAITWFSILPGQVKVEPRQLPIKSPSGRDQYEYEITVKDIPPEPREEFMPPTRSFTYRVLFNFTPFSNGAEFWKSRGKSWSKRMNSFADPNSELQKATQAVISGASSQDDKLKNIYATVMTVENTKFTRTHEAAEDKAAGRKVTSAADVLAVKRGTPTQVTQLFVGMARAAGMKAYLMFVPDRSEELFTPTWLNFSQFDDVIAIVNVDGKEVFFDPGERYCPYGHMAWQHTFVQGLRQTDDGTGFAETPGDPYTANRTSRVANLNMDEHGEVTGTVDLTFIGAPALSWRQSALRGDTESLNHQLRETLEHMLPSGVDVKVGAIDNLTAYEQPLKVRYTVKGASGTPTGKRLMVPADLFLVAEHATFPSEKREQPVYFHYPLTLQDAVRINLPATMTVEAVPDAAKYQMGQTGIYNMTVTSAPNNFVMRRNFYFNGVVVAPKDYGELRTFYTRFETKDKENVVLKPAAATTAAVVTPGAN